MAKKFLVLLLSALSFSASALSSDISPRVCESLLAATSETKIIRPYYSAIKRYYGTKRAKRSNLSLINHIDEGLVILDAIQASCNAKSAWCIHPLVQGDADLIQNFESLRRMDPLVVALAFEYRSVANEYLSFRSIKGLNEIRLSPLKDVNDMLIADKIQNRKDFELKHFGTHRRSKELSEYFKNWLDKLGITEEQYLELSKRLTADLDNYISTSSGFSAKEGKHTVQVSDDISIESTTHLGRTIPLRIYYPTNSGTYPVVIYSHGAGLNKYSHDFLGRFWASHGYISIHPTHSGADSSMLRNTNIRTLTLKDRKHNLNAINAIQTDFELMQKARSDLSEIVTSLPSLKAKLENFQGEIDFENIGVGGYSVGANLALMTAGASPSPTDLDPRVKSFFALSPPGRVAANATPEQWAKIQYPLMILSGSEDKGLFGESPDLRVEPFHAAPPGEKYHVLFEQVNHFSFLYLRPGKENFDQQVHEKLKLMTLLFWNHTLKGKVGVGSLLESKQLEDATQNSIKVIAK